MSISTVKLSRTDGTPWGFRLQGGKDFATPLCVQKVNAGSLAAVAGLQAGDAIVSIGGRDALALRHKEAQEAIVRAGNNFDLVIQRGSQVWRPQVTPLAQVKTTPEGVPVATNTSLAANKKHVAPVGVKHNVKARPFAEVNGQQIVNAQYNTPLQLYSEDNIAETLSAQAEVLGKGCLGVNFMKNERAYDGKTSDVLRMVQEMDSNPVKEPEGYYNINEKLYCDVHAKQAARHHPPAPNMDPIIVKPGAPTPSGALPASAVKAAAPYKRPVGGMRMMPSVPAPAPAPMPKFTPIARPKPAPIPAPAPAPIQVPAAPMAAPPPTFSPVKAPAAPAPQPAPFGAPAGGVDVRSHIPKKGPAPVLPKPTPLPNLGGGAMKGVAQTSGQKPAPRRGRGVMNPSNSTRIPMCADCGRQIRGPFVSALGKTWCPDHFVCSTGSCRKALIDMGFVEEQGALHCEDCYEKYLAPICGKCDKRVKGDCLNAVGKQFHPECFCCAYCGKIFGSGAFYLEDGLPYCEADWNDLFTTKCVGCGFPIEAGDRWVEALNNNYHSQCFKCSKCHKNLEGQSFFAKGGKPFCKAHAQRGL
ncbi:hypothetical protein O3P69_013576 [Scylla paramamosain]|uniref:PDZ and LIM domain protein Zasp n=1 Tax=Scylla paramamosain TaxID=85552 RepID=A0AAW0SNP7_SCYPA